MERVCDCLSMAPTLDGCVSVESKFPKFCEGRVEYCFHGYGEICNFVFCLLMKTKTLSSLPGITAWEEFMSVSQVSEFPSIPLKSFLVSDGYGRELPNGKTGDVEEFRLQDQGISGSSHSRHCGNC